MMYEPQEDSYLLEEQVKAHAYGNVLDMGTGSGILARAAAVKAKNVLAVDIDKEALKSARELSADKKITFRHSNLFSGVSGVFDTVIFNPPYLPDDMREPPDIRAATTGGKHGYELLALFLASLGNYLNDDGIGLIVFSSLTKKEKVDELIENCVFDKELLSSRKIHFETLYVYLLRKSALLRSLNGITSVHKAAHGRRGIVYSGISGKKKIAIKAARNAVGERRLGIEAMWLRILNRKGIGPRMLKAEKNFIIMDYIEGERILKFVEHASKNEILTAVKDVLHQCFAMDRLHISKGEMHHPLKHILVHKGRAMMIDFERCRKSMKPKNVTQFCQFLKSGQFSYGIGNRGIAIPNRLLKFAQKYKRNMTVKNFEMIIREL